VIIQTLKLGKLLIVVMAFAILSGCAVTSVVSRSGLSTADSKLTSVRVVWIENPSIPIQISKQARGYRPTIDDYDKADAQRTVGQLVSTFRSAAPAKIRAQLTPYKVNEGAEATIELTPVTSNVNMGGGRGFNAKVTVRKAGSTAEVWSVTIRVIGPMSESDQVLLDKFVVALMNELKSAGWVG
jgi:hypothetical protein